MRAMGVDRVVTDVGLGEETMRSGGYRRQSGEEDVLATREPVSGVSRDGTLSAWLNRCGAHARERWCVVEGEQVSR